MTSDHESKPGAEHPAIDANRSASAGSEGESGVWDTQGGPIEGRRRRALIGGFWVVAMMASQHVTRLISNLVLTRLLFPDDFGLMAYITIVMNVLLMFSDLGLNVAVVRSKRADQGFINCAWTIRLIRGVLLWLIAVALAWPTSAFFGESDLLIMIPIAALTVVIAPFGSPSQWFCSRKIHLLPIFWRGLFANVSGLLFKIILAIYLQSVWALILGMIFVTVLNVVTSYWIMPEIRPRLAWDRSAFHELMTFGKWLFFGSILTFIVQQGDKLVLGKMLTKEMLGIYVIAMILPRAVIDLLIRMNSSIQLPIYADLYHHASERLRSRILQSRIVLNLVGLGSCCVLAVGGQYIIDFLYDPRYVQAGWMLQIIAVGVIPVVINMTSLSIALPVGDSFAHFVGQLYKSAAFITGMAVGGTLFGVTGLLIGIAVANVASYPIVVWVSRRHGVWFPWFDLGCYTAAFGFVAIGWTILGPPQINL